MSVLLMNSSHSVNDNEYFYNIDKEFTEADHDQKKIHSLYLQELNKYKKTNDLKYLLSSKYGEIFLNTESRSKKISLIYELIRINDDHYEYITAACNFFLALELEDTSPKLCLQFLNEAIKIEEKSPIKNFLPHMYHAKGRWYFTHKSYSLARIYFGKALVNFSKRDTMYIASMHNNFALCDMKTGNFDSGIKQTRYAINILKTKKKLTGDEITFMHKMIANLGLFYFYKKDYVTAERYLVKDIDYSKSEQTLSLNGVKKVAKLLSIYQSNKQLDKVKEIILLYRTLLPKTKPLKAKIAICEILVNYYIKNNDIPNVNIYSDLLIKYNNQNAQDISEEIDNVSNVLNGYILKNINQQYDVKIESQKRKNILLVILIVAVIAISVRIIFKIRKKNEAEKNILEEEKSLLESNKENLEKDLQFQQGKIKNLHLNLNLKIETEKAFLENLKKIKRSKNIDAESTVRDLFFKINNLLQIDEKNCDLINESSIENKEFMEKLSNRFSTLTDHELKLCVLYRLNLSSKEVSLLENVTPGSARVYKSKIKSKMKLDKEEDLGIFLNSIK
ncbi:hypothetical protein [Chryseobacterium soldanellicola]|uniref:hypothetical protein n=1 Tax=Chryseobacterium soldanellicola TaxID=311333 RepID=UPI0011145C6A|nr:hypothetical protein [Chryseobacterium soldanellicola]